MRTVTIETRGAPFHTEHQRTLRQRNRDASRLDPPPVGSLAGRYEPTVVEAASATWRKRMVNEHRSAGVFAALVPQFIEASSTLDVQTLALRCATDEIHHAVLCGEVVRAFGGEAVATAEPTLRTMPVHPGIDPVERVMRNVMFVGCLSETVAVALITEERELATEPFVRATFDRILADEVAHARLGWGFLARCLETLDDAARARTEAYLRVAFGYLERNEIALLPVVPDMPRGLQAQREAIGLCAGTLAQELFYQAVENVIVPRLHDLGIDARTAWRTRGVPAAVHTA